MTACDPEAPVTSEDVTLSVLVVYLVRRTGAVHTETFVKGGA